MVHRQFRSLLATAALLSVATLTARADEASLGRSLLFHASFDDSIDADRAAGDRRIYTAESTKREQVRAGNAIDAVTRSPEAGRFGGALRFAAKTAEVLFYAGEENVGYRPETWSGTVSVWLRLDPDRDLEPGFCDPIQITDKTWNDSAFFIDFDKELPRDFRLGVFPDYKTWNPQDTPWGKFPLDERPMVVVERPPFSAEEWTHVAFTWSNVNRPQGGPGTSVLYLNGEAQGSLERPLPFSWNESKAAIMIGLNYIGLMDDLAVFDRALTAEEIRGLYGLPAGVAGLQPPR